MTLEPVHPWGATPGEDWCEMCWHGDGDARCLVCGRSTGGEWVCECPGGATLGPCARSVLDEHNTGWREQCSRCGARWAGPITPLPVDDRGRKVCPPFDATNCKARATDPARNLLAVFAEEFTQVHGVGVTSYTLDRPAAWEDVDTITARGAPRPGFWHNVAAHPLLVLWPRLGEWLHERTRP